MMLGERGELFVDGRCVGRLVEPTREDRQWAHAMIEAHHEKQDEVKPRS